ncbi:MAG TPA: lysine--tRNA ligase [Candidatus Dormibacteraeota bacterium]|nr:lysine--tRNA ligase [Candidatus Dormibacteraeota bacterium]
MQWLTTTVDQLNKRFPKGQILIESGGSPSGTYHLGHMRELIICDALVLELRRSGREAKHIYFVDDLDALRKVPTNVPAEFSQYLGMPICDVPAPDGSRQSYAEYFLEGLINSCKSLNIEVEFIRSHQKYRAGFFIPAIERSLERVPQIRQTLEKVSNRRLDENWTPIQVLENGRLKNRPFLGIDKVNRNLSYLNSDGQAAIVSYAGGAVKLDWRLDWPARWWLLKVQAEPFGREHASAGGSYDSGVQLMSNVFEAQPPIAVAYESINMIGDTKKMSASKGTAVSATEGLKIMPAEVLRYFILRAPLNKRLYFDPVEGVVKLMDEFASLVAKADPTKDEEQLLYVCSRGEVRKTVSRVPFSQLVASYQASLEDANKTLEIVRRSEHGGVVEPEADIIKSELRFISEWLKNWAPEEIKFKLRPTINATEFTEPEKKSLKILADKIAEAPADADGVWFHNAIYELKDSQGLEPKEIFNALYRALISKTSGPRAGYFLSILPRQWLVARLRLES